MRTTLLLAALPAILVAQEPIDTALNAKLREAGLKNGQVMRLVHELCDHHGPRLTASPTYKAAADWAVAKLKGWGLEAKQETWDFGHPGWSNQWCSAHVVEPYQDPLPVEVISWTPGTKGLVKGTTVALTIPEKPTAETLEAALATVKDKVKGAIVLVGPHKVIPPDFKPRPLRQEEAALRERFDPFKEPVARPGGPGEAPTPGVLDAKAVAARIDTFLVEQKALVRVNDGAMQNGQVRAFNNRTYDITKAVPTVVMRSEDFGRLWRIMGDGGQPKLAFEIKNTVHPELTQGINVVGELKGTEKPDEVVYLTAHLDSWHTATGATDNGANCAAMMEALRLLKSAGAQPKRTIRVVLFDGEEQGLLGATAYAKAHFGTPQAWTPEAENVVALFNMDAGAGQLRGLSLSAPKATGLALHEILVPWRDLGVVGAAWSKNRPAKPGMADVTVFTHHGLPAGGPGQDGLEYFNYTWHTNIDSFERILPEDAARNATVLASVAFHIANRPERLPRWKVEELPPLPTEKAPEKK